jgi:hypothetical protein
MLLLVNFVCVLYLKYHSDCDRLCENGDGNSCAEKRNEKSSRGDKKSRNPKKIEMSTPNAQSVAGYFVGRGNRERRKSLAFLQVPSRMHAFDRTSACWQKQ